MKYFAILLSLIICGLMLLDSHLKSKMKLEYKKVYETVVVQDKNKYEGRCTKTEYHPYRVTEYDCMKYNVTSSDLYGNFVSGEEYHNAKIGEQLKIYKGWEAVKSENYDDYSNYRFNIGATIILLFCMLFATLMIRD